MTYTLTVSSQGQIIIPVDVRKHLGITPGSQIKMRPQKIGNVTSAIIEPSGSWTERVTGIGHGLYGQGETYIDHERNSWQKP